MSHSTAEEEEFATIGSVMDAMYRAVSGPKRGLDIELERRVFTPDARLIRTGLNEDGTPWRQIMTIDEYEEDVREFLNSVDFYEYETNRTVMHCQPFAYVLSEYEAKNDLDSEEVIFGGVNSAQCLYDGRRWWINQLTWNRRD